jgi:L-asparaginase
MNNRTSILLIYTGGTIGMVQDIKSGALYPLSSDELYRNIPVLENFNYNIEIHCFDPLIDSADMNPGFWVKLAEVIETNYEDYDGFVVLHGSDTMAYTASMLSFMLENLNKAVILTGSQLPLGVIRTDGRENLINAIEIAAAESDDTPVVPEVCIYFENQLLRGNRTHKYNAENFDAFLSGNYPVLAEAGVHIKYNYNYILKPNFKKLRVHKSLNPNIAILKLYPGIDKRVIDAVFNTEGLEAVVIETYGTGNAPTDQWFLNSLLRAVEKEIIILNVTQCKGGSVDQGKYSTSVRMDEIGVVGGYDITTESAVAKLMYLLGRFKDKNEIKKLLQKPLRGEMSVG